MPYQQDPSADRLERNIRQAGSRRKREASEADSGFAVSVPVTQEEKLASVTNWLDTLVMVDDQDS